MSDILENIGLWITVILEYIYDVYRYGLRGAEERTLDKAIRFREELQVTIDRLERNKGGQL